MRTRTNESKRPEDHSSTYRRAGLHIRTRTENRRITDRHPVPDENPRTHHHGDTEHGADTNRRRREIDPSRAGTQKTRVIRASQPAARTQPSQLMDGNALADLDVLTNVDTPMQRRARTHDRTAPHLHALVKLRTVPDRHTGLKHHVRSNTRTRMNKSRFGDRRAGRNAGDEPHKRT